MANSVHDKLSKVRKPRVHIKYDVETEGAREKKELPFVAGVMGDFSGDGSANLPAFKDRKFIQIDSENFDDVMEKYAPELNFKVENTMRGDGSEMGVNLKFESMEDFEPAKLAEQVPALKKLLETRKKLEDLLSKADLSEDLEKALEDVLQNSENLEQLSKELGVERSALDDANDDAGEPK